MRKAMHLGTVSFTPTHNLPPQNVSLSGGPSGFSRHRSEGETPGPKPCNRSGTF
jgi:hypothetical protein